MPRRMGRGGSGAGPLPTRRASTSSALGADFRRQVGAAAPAQPAPRPTALDQWHVAIQDVPVGPIKRDEITRKMAAGAITAESLAWREGFDDWRPIRDIPELSVLLRQRRPVAPPRPAIGRGAGRSRPGARSSRPSSRPGARESSRPAARSNVVPIGGRLGAAPAPPPTPEEEIFAEAEPTRISEGFPPGFLEEAQMVEAGLEAAPASQGMAVMSPDVVANPFAGGAEASSPGVEPGFRAARPPSRQSVFSSLPVGAWIAFVGAAAFGVAFAVMLAAKMFTGSGQAPAAAAQAPTATAPSKPSPQLVLPSAQTAAPEQPAEGPEQPGTTRVAHAGAVRRHLAGTGAEATPTSRHGKQLSADQRALIAQMGADDGSGGNLGAIANRAFDLHQRQHTGQTLNAQQLTSVVSRNRPGLQRCYETAIRGMGAPPAVRLDVDLTVGTSGMVTHVRARGNDVSGLVDCVQGAVRRWHFPNAGDSTQTSFPVVFQPGA